MTSRESFPGPLAPGEDYDLLTLDGLDLSGQDGRRARFVECALHGCTLDETRLDGAHLVDTEVHAVRGSTVHVRDGTWRGVRWRDARVGALLAAGSRWDDVELRGGKVDYLTLAGAKVDTLRLADIRVGDLDLSGAQVRRLVLDAAQVDRLDVTGATLRGCDLRGGELGAVAGVTGLAGATLSEDQAMALAVTFARELRITIP